MGWQIVPALCGTLVFFGGCWLQLQAYLRTDWSVNKGIGVLLAGILSMAGGGLLVAFTFF